MGTLTPDRFSFVILFSIMNPGNGAEEQGIYPGCKETAVHRPNTFAATLRPQ